MKATRISDYLKYNQCERYQHRHQNENRQLKQDRENYIKFHILGGQKKLKVGVVPHIFACQEDRKRSAPATPRETSVKRSRQHLVDKILSSVQAKIEHEQGDLTNIDTSSLPSNSTSAPGVSKFVSKRVQTMSPPRVHYHRATSPVLLRVLSFSDSNTEFDSSSSESVNHDSDFIYSTDDGESNESRIEKIKRLSLERIMQLVPLQSRLYLGVPEHSYFIINLLGKYTPVPVTVVLLSADLSKLIMWPLKQKIKQLLPTAFIANYSNVQSIIDCSEIESEKPSNAIHQNLTWSEYKNANTLKYLISATSNGMIMYISTRFGGWASDALIVEHNGFLRKFYLNRLL
ncbi:hypothetical protein ILUMI_26778 [Ignelater luminosus]|uniref:DDE Tnp4 domain-containing protein n=1 Tax=Ignelater luminosus TaxID=2038154 RepID=A0A8K0C416_IGNLU|nr:hypothetical protein ILUMI_26778 [Ignelater luminosus]